MNLYCNPGYKYAIFALAVYLLVTRVLSVPVDMNTAILISVLATACYLLLENFHIPRGKDTMPELPHPTQPMMQQQAPTSMTHPTALKRFSMHSNGKPVLSMVLGRKDPALAVYPEANSYPDYDANYDLTQVDPDNNTLPGYYPVSGSAPSDKNLTDYYKPVVAGDNKDAYSVYPSVRRPYAYGQSYFGN
jgi:hypothetical protein